MSSSDIKMSPSNISTYIYFLYIYLLWYLPEIVNKAYSSRLFQWVVNVVDIHLSLIEEMVKDIDSIYSSWSLLLVSKDQVYPFMQVGTDVVTFQGLKKQ